MVNMTTKLYFKLVKHGLFEKYVSMRSDHTLFLMNKKNDSNL